MGRRVIVLWGSHRLAPGNSGLQPTSIDKGVPELAALGHDIVSIYPRSSYLLIPGLLRRMLAGRGARLSGVLQLLRIVGHDDMIYTVDHKWAAIVAFLKRLGWIRAGFVFKWAGFDFDWSADGPRSSIKRRIYRQIVGSADTVFFASARQMDIVVRSASPAPGKMRFWPTAVDLGFYRAVASSMPDSASGLVAVGSDARRDWSIIIGIARRGIAVTVLTDDAEARRLIETAGADCRPMLRLEYDVGLRRSAEIIAAAQAVIVATRPNDRFSGSTTVGVAAALGKPLILDEPHDLASYGLIPGWNCEYFERGDVASALQAIDRVQAAPHHARHLSGNIARIADDFDIHRFADALASVIDLAGGVNPVAPAAPSPCR